MFFCIIESLYLNILNKLHIVRKTKGINVFFSFSDMLTIPEAKERQLVSSLSRQELEDRYLRLREESVVSCLIIEDAS